MVRIPRVSFYVLPFLVVLAGIPSSAQRTITTAAGGAYPKMPAQNLALGTVTGLAVDPSGAAVFSDYYVLRRIASDGTVQNVAGDGRSGVAGDGGPAAQARIGGTLHLTYDGSGNLYFADSGRIRKIDGAGIITTVAGTGIPGTLGAGGPAASAQLLTITSIAADGAGNVYFTESGQNWIRRLTVAGTIEVFAGATMNPDCVRDGNGAAASAARLCRPNTVAVSPSGKVYFSEASVFIRRISPDGTVDEFAGYGSMAGRSAGDGGPAKDANFASITTMAASADGSLYVADSNTNSSLRRIRPDNSIVRLEGTGRSVYGLAVAPDGTIYFTGGGAIHKMDTMGSIEPIAGGDPRPAAPDGIPAHAAYLLNPYAMAVSRSGELYFADHCTIRKVGIDGILRTAAGTGVCSVTAPAGPALSANLPDVYAIAVNSQGGIYFSGTYTEGGKTLIGTYPISADGMIGSSLSDFFLFTSLDFDSQDRLYLNDAQFGLYRYAPGGTFERLGWGLGNYRPPVSNRGLTFLAIDASDNVYAIWPSAGPGRNMLYKFDSQGQQLAATQLSLNENSLEGMAVDPSGRLWISAAHYLGWVDGNTWRRIQPCCALGYAGDGGPFVSARLFDPSQLVFAPNGDLYILDIGVNSPPGLRVIRKVSGAHPSVAPVASAGGVLNAASFTGGAVAPGELIAIFGSNFSTGGLQVFALENNQVPKTLSNMYVSFLNSSGRESFGAIAALTPNQINVFVPYAVAGRGSAKIAVSVDGIRSNPVQVDLAATAPWLSTANTSGSGQGAILNQDGSLNSAVNPASAGSVVVLYGTGEGTGPGQADGALALSQPFPLPDAPITAMIGGKPAQVLYSGAAPFLPSGVFQLNVRIPDGLPTGDAPVVVTAGGITTSNVVTVAVQ